MPLIEIARAASQEEAMAGLERWKARHPQVWPYLAPADVLVDSMRGRSSAWIRIRLNLRHVPEAERPPQEPLEVDYDPWNGWTPGSPRPDGGRPAGAGPDAGEPDATNPDAPNPDAAKPDAPKPDAPNPDAARPDDPNPDAPDPDATN